MYLLIDVPSFGTPSEDGMRRRDAVDGRLGVDREVPVEVHLQQHFLLLERYCLEKKKENSTAEKKQRSEIGRKRHIENE